MINFVQNADSFDLIAPVGGVTSGTPVLIGKLLAIPTDGADAGEKFCGALSGIFEVTAKSADTPSAGALAYWDNTLFHVTTTSAGMTLCGYFMEAKAGGVTTAKIKLQPAVS